jgi:hypothetical protein
MRDRPSARKCDQPRFQCSCWLCSPGDWRSTLHMTSEREELARALDRHGISHNMSGAKAGRSRGVLDSAT